MGYLKMTLANGDVKTILADGILAVEDSAVTPATEIDITYNTAEIATVTVASASDQSDVKEAIRAALVKYQGNQEGPAIEANGGKSVSNVTSA
jgi:hypothetical protein